MPTKTVTDKPATSYARLGFVALHIKRDTRNRLNRAKADLATHSGENVSHDDLINVLLDRHLAAALKKPAAVR